MSADPINPEHERLLKEVSVAINQIVAESSDGTFLPAHVKATMLAHGQPLAAWKVRGCLSDLEARGALWFDSATGRWQLAANEGVTQAAKSA